MKFRLRFHSLFVVAVLASGGCGVDPGKNPDQVDITGSLTQGGKPVSDVYVNLQPTGIGTQASFQVTKGQFAGKATPGKYTYFISGSERNPAFLAVPQKYRAGSMDRQIDIKAGSTLAINLDD